MGTESGESGQCSRWEGALIVADIRDVLTPQVTCRTGDGGKGPGREPYSHRGDLVREGMGSTVRPPVAQLGEEEEVLAGPGSSG